MKSKFIILIACIVIIAATVCFLIKSENDTSDEQYNVHQGNDNAVLDSDLNNEVEFTLSGLVTDGLTHKGHLQQMSR